jgi:Bacterial membrane protein YfhO
VPDFRTDVGASTWAFEPWAEVTSRAYANGEIPLWNPYQGAGAPHAANMQSAAFDPLLLAVNLHPTPLVWDLSMVAGFVLGAAAAYLFGRVLGLRTVPAVVTSAVFSLSGWFFLYSNNHFSRSYAFLPLLFLLVELVLRYRRVLPVFGLAVAVAVNLYIGMPEASFFVIGTASVYAAVRLVQERTTIAMRDSVVRLGGAGLLGFMLAAPLLLMFLEYESLSFNLHKPELDRGAEADPAISVLHWIVPWFPDAPELPEARPRNWFGVAVAVAALVAVSGRHQTRRLHGWLFLAIGGFVVIKIYDPGVLEWFGRLPVVELVFFPIFAAPVASFAFAVLAGIGVQVLWNRDLQPWRFLTLFVVALIVLVVALSIADRFRVIVEEVQAIGLRGAYFGALAIAAVLLAYRLGRRWAPLILSGVILAELLWLAPLPSKSYPMRADPFLTPGWMPLVREAQGDEPHARVFGLDGKLYPNTAGALGLQDIRVLDAMYVERYHRFLQTFIAPEVFDRFTGEEAAPRLAENPMFDALGVRAVLAARDLDVPGLRLLGRDLDTRVYENTNAYPRAWVVHDLHVVRSEDEAFAFLRSRARRQDGAFIVNAFDPRREAVVELNGDADRAVRALQDSRTECNANSRDRATIERYTGRSVTLRVDAACPGLLVLPDTYFPGWKARVNGEEREILATDGAFRGVTVPEGSSRVEVRYEPRAFPTGIVLAVTGLLGFGVVWLVSRWRSRRLVS